MVKFFLEKNPQKKTPTDYRIISFFKMIDTVKRIRQFAIQKTIKKLKKQEEPKLQQRLSKLKLCHNDILRVLTAYLLKTECQMELDKQEKFFQSKIGVKLSEMDQRMEELKTSHLEYLLPAILKHQSYTQTLDDIQGLLVKVEKKMNITKQKKQLKKERVRERKEEKKEGTDEVQEEKERKEPQKIKIIKKQNKKQENEKVKTRYDNRPKPRTQFKKTGRNKHLAQKKQKQRKVENPYLNPNQSTHPSWQAKLQQNAIVPFQGKRILLK